MLREATASDQLCLAEEYENQQSWREARDKLTFILCLPDIGEGNVYAGQEDREDRMVGDVNLFVHCDDDDGEKRYRAEIDIMIAEESARGRGVGRTAVCALIVFLRKHIGEVMRECADHTAVIEDLMVKIQQDNGRSVGLFEGLGFCKTAEAANYFGEWELVMQDWVDGVVQSDWWEGASTGYLEKEYVRE